MYTIESNMAVPKFFQPSAKYFYNHIKFLRCFEKEPAKDYAVNIVFEAGKPLLSDYLHITTL